MNKNKNLLDLKRNIFYNNINKKYKLIPFNIKENDIGNIQYSPADSKEWKDKIYFFNHNYIKNLPVHRININKILKSYFNFYLKNKFLFKKHIPRSFKRSSFNKIYVSRPEIKYISSKAIITIYVFNRENISLIKNIKKLREKFFFNIFLFFIKNKTKYSDNFEYYNKMFKLMSYKELMFIRRYKLRLDLNKYKFHNVLLYKLGKFIGKILDKSVQFNIVNLQSIALNPDVFTEFLRRKFKRRNVKVGKTMNFILARIKLLKIKNSIREKDRLIKNVDFKLLENKYKNINLNYVINKHNTNINILKKKENFVAKSIFLKKKRYSFLIKRILFNSIKYKLMAGIKLEVKGRLTKRYRADRSIYKLRLKGGLKNADSAFKGLSTVTFRGYANSNVEYSIRTSKRRIGAFAVKGWISGK